MDDNSQVQGHWCQAVVKALNNFITHNHYCDGQIATTSLLPWVDMKLHLKRQHTPRSIQKTMFRIKVASKKY